MNDKRLPAWLTILFCLVFQNIIAQPPDNGENDFLLALMRNKLPKFGYILDNPSKYRLQIIYTKIDRDEKNLPVLTTYYYRNLPNEFISPASMVKLPLSILTLERIKSMNVPGVDRYTRFSTDSNFRCQVATTKDPFAFDSIPTLSGSITEALVLSNNNAYNRLYEFLGQMEINRRMRELGYLHSQVLQRFSLCDTMENRHTNSFSFYDKKGTIIYWQVNRFNPETYPKPIKNMVVGKKYLDEHDRIVQRGMDFSRKNYLPLYQVDDILKRVIFPGLYPENKRFRVSPGDLDYIRRLLALRPAEAGINIIPVKKEYWETVTNYLFYGAEKETIIPENIRIFNIVGQSFGFLSDCAYYADFSNRIEFFLSATIYVNSNNTINDGIYEYKSIGLPFLKKLGEVICDYELRRQVKQRPNLSEMEKLFNP